jgi:general stress protein 26
MKSNAGFEITSMGARMNVAAFVEIATEFNERIGRAVWCNVATVDRQGRPRSRILHPVWEGPLAWIGTRRHSLKTKHLDRNPYVSLAYIADVAKPVYADCRAEWIDDLAEKRRVWDVIKSAPPPVGYDPAPIFGSFDDPRFGLLRLTPWRIELSAFPAEPLIWRGDVADSEIPALPVAADGDSTAD